MHSQGPTQVNTSSLLLFTFWGWGGGVKGSKGPWSAKSKHQRLPPWPRAGEASEWHIKSDGSLKLSAGVGHPAEHRSPPGAMAKTLTRCCPCSNIDVYGNVWKPSLNCPLWWMGGELTWAFLRCPLNISTNLKMSATVGWAGTPYAESLLQRAQLESTSGPLLHVISSWPLRCFQVDHMTSGY